MPKVTGVSHVVLYVEDLEKMTEFYRDVLGFKITHENPGRMNFLSARPEVEDHEIALARGREGSAKIINHIALHVATVQEICDFYSGFVSSGVPIDHCVSHGNTVSCYFLDPEGNRLEVFALVDVEPGKGYHGPLDLTRSAEELTDQVKGLAPVG
jgi:catechol-2,3-dioxygenase